MRVILLIIIVVLSACHDENNLPEINIKGSDSEKELVEKLAEEFIEKNNINIEVEGKGTNSGIEALISGEADIANASRKITNQERNKANQNNVHPYEIVFAQDAIAFIVDANIGIDSISIEDLNGIFIGRITNWNQLGGPNRLIQPYGRNGKSGTHKFVNEKILNGQAYCVQLIEMESNRDIIQAISEDDSGIGYVGAGFLDEKTPQNIKVLKVYEKDFIAFSPLEESDVITGNYPVVRPFYQYTNNEPSGDIKLFIDFELSNEGNKIIRKMGYYPVAD